MTQQSSAAERPNRGEAKPPAPPPLSAQEQAAIAHARDNKSVYPRRLRSKDLQYTVVNAERREDGNMLVTLTYRPASFRGRPGEERILVAPNGDVVQRTQVHAPQENFPWFLAVAALASVIVAPILIFLILTSDERTANPLYVAGRILWMEIEEPDLVQAIQYQGSSTSGELLNWQIAPQNPENVLAMVKVNLINQRTSRAVVVIDESAAKLLSDRGFTYTPVNVVTESKSISSLDSGLLREDFIGLWRTIPISAGENLEGWMVFEVPPGTKFREFRWEASDQIIARF